VDRSLQAHHYFWLSTAAAIVTIVLKTLAWWMTGSVGLASDAMESFVNLAGATFALWMITVARLPPDDDHPLGHSKAEYFSSGFEGLLIFGAAAAIIWSGAGRLLHPHPLESVGAGLLLSAGSSGINLFVAVVMRRAAVRFRSVALEGGWRHLMADVWTSAGVIAGIAAVVATGWLWLDAIVAIAVGLHVLLEGVKLVRTSAQGLMDASLAPEELEKLERVVDGLRSPDISFARLRTRRAGARSFVYLDVLVPGQWTVAQAHAELDRIEADIGAAMGDTVVFTHAEPAPLRD
jgi:cation diffusion facilitator family transporter